MLKYYLSLVKPGIITGNVIAASGGFFLGKGDVSVGLYFAVALGTSLVVASGCVFNNLIDSDIDAKMKRTQSRPLVQGTVKHAHALWFATVLGLCGFAVLWWLTTPLATYFALLGFVVYVGFYSLYFKRNSVHGTVIGSVSGACPPVIGYTAVTNQFDSAALCVFIAFAAWQMPHSYAIAINRQSDYAAASIPVLPIVKGIAASKYHMILYCLLFWGSIVSLTIFNHLGLMTSVIMSVGSAYWLYQMVTDYGDSEDTQRAWGRSLFSTSVILIVLLSVLMATDTTV